jgi:hypothetical protein
MKTEDRKRKRSGRRKNKRSGSCMFAERYADASGVSVSSSLRLFSAALLLAAISAAKSVLAGAFVVLF